MLGASWARRFPTASSVEVASQSVLTPVEATLGLSAGMSAWTPARAALDYPAYTPAHAVSTVSDDFASAPPDASYSCQATVAKLKSLS